MPRFFSREDQHYRTPDGRTVPSPTLPLMPRWVPGVEDLPPADAVPSVPERCDACPAAARVVLRGVVLWVPDGWRDTVASVVEMHLCGHHGRRHEAAATEAGWVVIYSRSYEESLPTG
jgi:hypothetical protein